MKGREGLQEVSAADAFEVWERQGEPFRVLPAFLLPPNIPDSLREAEDMLVPSSREPSQGTAELRQVLSPLK